jgi:hypothetical protein
VWSIRFRVSAARDAIEILPPLGEERAAVNDDEGAAVPGPALSVGSEEGEVFDTDAAAARSLQKRKGQARL